jgi:hypothetical protein
MVLKREKESTEEGLRYLYDYCQNVGELIHVTVFTRLPHTDCAIAHNQISPVGPLLPDVTAA